MKLRQGDVTLLEDPVAKRLLESTIPARLAYNWTDGTPRVVPIWFHWNGSDFILSTPPKAPKLKAIRDGSRVALTIDENGFPPGVLLVRGAAPVKTVDGLTPEYDVCARRYFGEEGGKNWVAQMSGMVTQMGRIAIRPDWIGILDFESRFPSALSA